jgi:hypothetical protein
LQHYFSYVEAVSFIGGENRRTRRNPAVAKELLTFCLEPYCKCDPVHEKATCSGLDFVPKIPDFVHNLILAYNNFSDVNVSRQFLSNASQNDLKLLTFIRNSVLCLNHIRHFPKTVRLR